MATLTGFETNYEITRFRDLAQFHHKSAGISALTAFAKNEEIADSRTIIAVSVSDFVRKIPMIFRHVIGRKEDAIQNGGCGPSDSREKGFFFAAERPAHRIIASDMAQNKPLT